MGNSLSFGEDPHVMGIGNMGETKKVDAQGRISLPASWRARRLGDSDDVVVIEKDGVLLVKPKAKPDLTRYFDAVPVDVDPKDFDDYSKLRKAILGRRRK